MLQDVGHSSLPNVGISICKAKPSHQMVNLNNSVVRSSNLEINLIPPDRQSSEFEVQHEMMTLNGPKDRRSVKQTNHLSTVVRMMLGLLQSRTLDLQWKLVKITSAFTLHAKYWRLLSIPHITARRLQSRATSPSCVIKHLRRSFQKCDTATDHLAKPHTNYSIENNNRICPLLTDCNVTK